MKAKQGTFVMVVLGLGAFAGCGGDAAVDEAGTTAAEALMPSCCVDGGGEGEGEGEGEDRKVTICHATGSTKNPYVKITISRSALPAHLRHQDGRDIFPDKNGDCVEHDEGCGR